MVFSKYCSIEYDRLGRLFYPGDTVSGFIKLNLVKEKSFQDLVIRYLGDATCRWTETHGSGKNSRTDTYTGVEEYFRRYASLFDDYLERIDSSSSVALPKGVYKFPFSVKLPNAIPASQTFHYGQIKYSIKVTAKRETCFDKSASWDFIVCNNINLNDNPSNKLPINETLSCAYYTITYKGKTDIHVNIPLSGYVPEQEMIISCDINNTNSQVSLEQILYTLRKTTTYKANFPRDKCKIIKENIFEGTGESVKYGKNSTQMMDIKIPDTFFPSTRSNTCPINVQYSFKIKAVPSGIHKKFKKHIPINIGTMPVVDENLIREREPNISTPCYSMASGESASVPFVNPYGAIENPCSLFITPNPPSINLNNLILNVNPPAYLNESTNPSATNEEIRTPPSIGFSIPPSSSSSSVEAPPTYEESLILLAGMNLEDQNNEPSTSSRIEGV